MRACFYRVLAVLFILLAHESAPASAQDVSGQPATERELVVGVKENPPFAMKAGDGVWQGISVELWRKVAADLKLRYRFEEVQQLSDLIEQTANGRVDVAVSALTVTSARERLVDFLPSFYTTGFGIAVPAGGEATWAPVIRAITSFGFIQSILALIGLALAVGIIVWFFERRHNEEFGGSVARGLSSSVWWTTVAMTQRGIGNFGPRTLPGRAIAMFWMVGSIIAIAIFTASITTVLTVKQLRGVVHDVGDLSEVRVGIVRDTATEDALAYMLVPSRGFPSLRDALLALRAGSIDAVVHDRPLLGWQINQEFRSSIELLDVTFNPQNYAFAVSPNSPLRKRISVSVLDAVQSGWWNKLLTSYVGVR